MGLLQLHLVGATRYGHASTSLGRIKEVFIITSLVGYLKDIALYYRFVLYTIFNPKLLSKSPPIIFCVQSALSHC